MNTSINTLKKSKNNLDRLAKEIERINKPSGGEEYSNEDDRFWRPVQDKAGNGYAVIRFLPGAPVDGPDALPWVRYFRHGFKGPTGKWYIENSLTTMEKTDDPVSKLNTLLWKTEDKDYQKIASAQKRKLTYISNILVVSDPSNPENEGKVFLYRYGKKIFDKINEAMFPPFPDKEKYDPFDMWEGANFKLKVRKVSDYINYDLSEFDTRKPVSADDSEMEKIWNQEYSLNQFVAPDQFKSYTELKKRLDDAIGCDTESDEVFSIYTKVPHAAATKFDGSKTTKGNPGTPPTPPTSPGEITDDEEGTMEYFQKLARGD